MDGAHEVDGELCVDVHFNMDIVRQRPTQLLLCVLHCTSHNGALLRSQHADNPGDAAFDTATRMLAFEGKAAPGQRALTEEERAVEQQQLAERMERARRARMLAPAGMCCWCVVGVVHEQTGCMR